MDGNIMAEMMITALLFVILFFVIVMIIDCHRFVVKEYTCISDKLKKDGRFVLLSDLHGKSFGDHNEKLRNAIEKIINTRTKYYKKANFVCNGWKFGSCANQFFGKRKS